MAAGIAAAVVAASAGCSRPDDEAVTGAGRGETTTEASPGGSDVDAALARGEFGTLDSVCGPAPDGEPNVDTASLGVTADQVEVGTFADPGNPALPGLGQEMFDASAVFADWCNSLGGIHGREIVVNEHDAALFNYEAAMVDACRSDFALVGGGGIMDSTGQDERLECVLPDAWALTGSPEARGADLRMGVTFPPDELNVGAGRYLNETYPDAADHAGILTGNVEGTRVLGEQFQDAGEQLGWTFVYDDRYNAVGESTYQPYAERIRDEGVRGLVILAEPDVTALVLQALADIGYQLDWVLVPPNNYDPKLIDTAGPALGNAPVYTWTTQVPFEAADQSVATQQYLRLFERSMPEARARSMQAVASFSAWLLFAQAAKGCGAELTRRCLWDQYTRLDTWDAGGLSVPAELSADHWSPCLVVMTATSDAFQIADYEATDGLFNCDPDNVVAVTDNGSATRGVQLADVGKSLDDLE